MADRRWDVSSQIMKNAVSINRTFAVIIIKTVVEEVQLYVSILLVHSWNQNPEVQSAKYKVEHTLFTSERNIPQAHAKLQGRGDIYCAIS